jgi:hypothetical protein
LIGYVFVPLICRTLVGVDANGLQSLADLFTCHHHCWDSAYSTCNTVEVAVIGYIQALLFCCLLVDALVQLIGRVVQMLASLSLDNTTVSVHKREGYSLDLSSEGQYTSYFSSGVDRITA